MPAFDDGHTATAIPESDLVTTDVLVVGSGPAGGGAALFLASLGVPTIMITKYRWTANTPRAHITNQRTMEILRDAGIEEEVMSQASPNEIIGDTVFCTSLAGEEIGRILPWGTHPARAADHRLASPAYTVDIPQTLLEPILVANAAKRGAQTRFSTEYVSHTQHKDHVDALVLDRLSGHTYTIRARYLIGADGARSRIAAEANLPFEGRMDIAGSMNITFKADIAALVHDRKSVLYWVIAPGANVGGIGAGLVRMVRPWNEWLIVWGYDIDSPPPVVDGAAAIEIVRSLIGVPDLHVEITGTSLWGNNEMYATELQRGRVFCVGDAIHRHPPSNGLGSNTSIQDSYNLGWKLAAVLRGQADPTLLDTYTAESAGRRADRQARQQIQPRVRRPLRCARCFRRRGRGRDARRDRGAQGQLPHRRRQTCRHHPGHGAQELRIQCARRRIGPVLSVLGDRRRGCRTAHARPGSRVVLPTLDGSRITPSARLAGPHRPSGLDP
nr:FAD-dependent monooxygenase [Gordonia polyisoprenivorans]